MYRNILFFVLALGLIIPVVLLTGCGAPTAPGEDDSDNGQSPEAKITILLIHNTDLDVDPHLYISKSDLDADALFSDANNIVANFDGKTTIEANGLASLAYDYDDVVTIGSSAAKFGSATDWEAGVSQDSPVLHQGTDFTANKVIVFRFSKDEQGNYHTSYTVADSAPSQ